MIVGITGGTASGKSTVAAFFEKYGEKVLNVDKLGWQILKKEKDKIMKELKIKSFNRREIGKIIFNFPDKKKIFDSIVHPPLIKLLKEKIKNSKADILFVDCALIYEWKIESWFDIIILVTASYENKVKRLKKLGLSEEEAKQRIKSQLPDEVKKYDFIIKNDNSIEKIEIEAKKILYKIKEKSKA